MKATKAFNEQGSTLIAALCTIMIVSMIGANVLLNCNTRYNATTSHTKGWKDALFAAESAGDVGYAECRKWITNRTNQFSGWSSPSPAPTPGPAWTKAVPPFGPNNSLAGSVVVDKFATIDTAPYYRIRATGTARLFGTRRAGMDSSMTSSKRGDNFLRKIDFNYDRFVNKYGDGDGSSIPGTPALVSNPQITRRIELIAVPVLPFEAAVKCTSEFYGPGSAGVIDSYDSHNGPYVFAANNPSHPFYADSRSGSVGVNSPTFTQGGPIYGDVGTNGGDVTHANHTISGTIDNAISFTVPPLLQPALPSGTSYQSGTPHTINPPADAGTKEAWYLYSNFDGVKINALKDADNNPIETYVTVIVTGNVGDVEIAKGVNAKIYFKGNLSAKVRDIDNNNVDGAIGVKNANGTASTNVSRAGHLQFYGISPTDGSTQTIDLNPGGGSTVTAYCTVYAPAAIVRVHGNPEFNGAIVCKTFYGNGNTGFHYDKALGGLGNPTEYRVASYVEDVR